MPAQRLGRALSGIEGESVRTLVFAVALLLLPHAPAAYADAAMRDMVAWLECEDCAPPAPRRVTRHGDALVPMLKSIVEQGPSPTRRERLVMAVESSYDQHGESVRDRPDLKLRWTKDKYVAHYVAAFDTSYRIRAVQALSAIGSAHARAALEASANAPLPPKVRREIEASLNQVR